MLSCPVLGIGKNRFHFPLFQCHSHDILSRSINLLTRNRLVYVNQVQKMRYYDAGVGIQKYLFTHPTPLGICEPGLENTLL